MASLVSKQAKNLFESPKFITKDSADWSYWKVTTDNGGIGLRFKGANSDWKIVLSEALARICEGKSMERLEKIEWREIDAFIRDRNSEAGWDLSEAEVKEGIGYLQNIKIGVTLSYSEVSLPIVWTAGQFKKLSLSERIKTLKSLFQGPFVQNLYRGLDKPNLLDVEDLTVYLQVPYESDTHREKLDELHSWLAYTLKEPDINLIPE